MGGLLCDIAIRPFMIINGSVDSIFSIDGMKEIYTIPSASPII
jgi:hypothetical protein